ncbi:ABC transporter ATP-binding protein [Phenylobacterium sp.]|uniref:ABC transporter ATP-binding protein n=1 Tax=Phenylobacterium sp. TaxID=1871053 RepID=UPI00301B85AA
MSRLTAAGLVVRRGGRDIVRDVSATLASGMFVALVGANGAGKSTLLSCLAGLLKPDGGEVTLDGVPLAGLDRRDLARRRAYLPQALRAEWPISVERLVALGLIPQLPAFGGLPGGFEPRLTRAIEAFDLAEHRFQPATTLSGGELARAMLARALVGDPEMVLVDEPTSGLDPRHALDTAGRLRRLATEGGKLVVATLHDMTLAARHATHLMALRDGALVSFGPTAETLTPSLLRAVFDVEACVSGEGREVYVDYTGPAAAGG